MITGLAMAGVGVATAMYVPEFLEKDAADFASESNRVYDDESAGAAKEGENYLFHGTLDESNREFERGIVVGSKSVWKERDRLAAKRASSREDKQRARAGWRSVEEYRGTLVVALDTGSKAELQLDSIRIEGKPFSVEDEVVGNKYQWSGLRRGDEISVRAEIASLEPLRLEQLRGQSLALGTPSEVVASEADTTAAVSKWTYLGGLGFAGLGGLVFLLGIVLKRPGT